MQHDVDRKVGQKDYGVSFFSFCYVFICYVWLLRNCWKEKKKKLLVVI